VTAPLWHAPRAQGPLSAVVRLPGSKSQTNRALVLAALAAGRSTVASPLRSRDTELMAAALRVLGVAVSDGEDGSWLVTGTGAPLQPTADRVDVGNAGTVARFLPPVATLATGAVRFDGDPRVRQRPVGRCSPRCAAWAPTSTGSTRCRWWSPDTAGCRAARCRWTPRSRRSWSAGCCWPPPASSAGSWCGTRAARCRARRTWR
jgi:hypothetical protein